MPTLSQYIMQVDQQNKQNAQQLVQQMLPLQQAMLQQRAKYEDTQAKKALAKERLALEEQKRVQGLQDKMIMAEYQNKLGLQSFAEKEKIKSVAPLTEKEKADLAIRQGNLSVERQKLALKESGAGKTTSMPSQKAISTAQSNYTKANNTLTNFSKSQGVYKLYGGNYLKVVGKDGKIYLYDRNTGEYYNSKGEGGKVTDKVKMSKALSTETGIAKKVEDYLNLESEAVRLGKEYVSIKGGKAPVQAKQAQSPVSNWDQFKG